MFLQIVLLVLLVSLFLIKQFSRKTTAPVISPLQFTNRNTVLPNLYKFVNQTNAHAVEVRGGNVVFLTHPDAVRDAVKYDMNPFQTLARFPKGTPMDTMLNYGLAFVNGEKWRHQRTTCAPAFQFESLKEFIPIFIEKSHELLKLLGPTQQSVNITPYLRQFNLDVFGATTLGMEFGVMKGEQGPCQQVYNGFLHLDMPAIEILFPQYARLPTKLNKYRKKLVDAMVEINNKLIAERKLEEQSKRNSRKQDLLDAIVAGNFTNMEISSILGTFFLAGNETTVVALSWAFYYLSKYPQYQKQLYEEVMTNIGESDPTFEKIKTLTFLDMFIKEVLRLGSPVPQLNIRGANEAKEIDGIIIPPHVQITPSIYVVHRLEEFWPEPEKFDPFRFSPENSQDRHPYAYLPFASGKRSCIGQNLSLLTQKVLLAMVVRKYHILFVRDPIPVMGVFYSPDFAFVDLIARN